MTAICLSGSVILKAGTNAKTLTETQYTELIAEATAFVCASSRYDWTSLWASLSGTFAGPIVKEAVSSWAAINVIENDMSGFTSRLEAQTMLDILWSKIVECVNLLRDEKFRTFVQTGVVS